MADYKVAVVAGVGSGIGARFVETFAQADYRVVALARNAESWNKSVPAWAHRRNVASFGQLTSQIQSRSRKPFFEYGTN